MDHGCTTPPYTGMNESINLNIQFTPFTSHFTGGRGIQSIGLTEAVKRWMGVGSLELLILKPSSHQSINLSMLYGSFDLLLIVLVQFGQLNFSTAVATLAFQG
jgi:hypothetical protein